MILILLFIFLIPASSIIFKDSGSFTQYFGSTCKNNFETTKTITFSAAFKNIPKVFFYQEYFDTAKDILEYQVAITSITLNNFQIFFKCPLASSPWQIGYQWIALDDQRIQVINAFNTYPPQDQIFNHQLLNVDTAIIGLISLGYSGQIEFQLSITGLTQDSVSVGITQAAGKIINLKQIGYQILLVVSRDIINLGQVTLIPTQTSDPINLQSNNWLILPIKGLKYNYGSQLNVRASRTTDASTITYKYEKWYLNNEITECTLQVMWLSYQLVNNQAQVCSSLRISQKLERFQSNRPRFYLQILQTNQIYNTIGQSSIRINKPILNFDFILEVSCITGKRVISKFNKCNSCSLNQKQYKYNHQCHSQINLISYFPKFTQIQSVNQEFSIIITATNCIVKQILYNQEIVEQDIINIEFQDP